MHAHHMNHRSYFFSMMRTAPAYPGCAASLSAAAPCPASKPDPAASYEAGGGARDGPAVAAPGCVPDTRKMFVRRWSAAKSHNFNNDVA